MAQPASPCALRRAHTGHDDADRDEPGRQLVGPPARRSRSPARPRRQQVYVSATNTDADSATTIASTTAAADGSFTVDVPITGGTSVLNIVASARRGGTAHAKRTILFDFVPGTLLLDVTDPDDDDNGPGNYAYPTSGNFQPGAFDIQGFQVFDAGTNVIFRLQTRDLSRDFGSPLGAQLVDVYVHVPGAGDLDGRGQRLAQLQDRAPFAWSRLIEVHGFGQRYVDELSTERAAERRRQVARLQAEHDVGAGVVDLEPLDVERARLEVVGRRIGVVARAVVVLVRVGAFEDQRAWHEVEHDRACRVRSAPVRADGDELSTLVPPVIATSTLNEPLPPRSWTRRSWPSLRPCSSPRCRLCSPAVVPVTVTGEPETDEPRRGS